GRRLPRVHGHRWGRQRGRDPPVRAGRRGRPRQHRRGRVPGAHRAGRPPRARRAPQRKEGLMPDRKPIIAGNWKMHHDHFTSIQYTQKLSYALDRKDYERVDVVLCPPFTDLRSVQTTVEADRLPILLGAQDVYWEKEGAFTGEISPLMLRKLNVSYVIVGHSERREIFGATDEQVNRKARAVLANDMTPIVCVGETLEEREAGATEDKVLGQVAAAFA